MPGSFYGDRNNVLFVHLREINFEVRPHHPPSNICTDAWRLRGIKINSTAVRTKLRGEMGGNSSGEHQHKSKNNIIATHTIIILSNLLFYATIVRDRFMYKVVFFEHCSGRPLWLHFYELSVSSLLLCVVCTCSRLFGDCFLQMQSLPTILSYISYGTMQLL